jgi:hypothetical protein
MPLTTVARQLLLDGLGDDSRLLLLHLDFFCTLTTR